MKTILLLLTILFNITTTAQKTETYYDYMWKPCKPEVARFYSQVTKTDSGWLRLDYFLGTKTLQMSGLFEDSANKVANGFFRYYYSNGNPESFGTNVHNKKEGLWLRFHHNGMLEDSTVYTNGKPAGTSLGCYSNGYPSDSVVYGADGSAVEVNWCMNGNPSGAGRLMDGKLNGVWTFFYNNGTLAARETYHLGQLQSGEYFNASGNKSDSATSDSGATFPGGVDGWKKFVLKHIFFPSQ